jgi:hypothetical protein
MNRRSLFRKLGAVAAVVAVTPAVGPDTVQAKSESERYVEASLRGMQAAEDATAITGERWLFIPEGYVEMRERTYALREVNRAIYEHGLATWNDLMQAREA